MNFFCHILNGLRWIVSTATQGGTGVEEVAEIEEEREREREEEGGGGGGGGGKRGLDDATESPVTREETRRVASYVAAVNAALSFFNRFFPPIFQ